MQQKAVAPGWFWRLNRRVWGYRLANAVVFRPAIDAQGRVLRARPVIDGLHQRLIEAGYCPPWIMTADECEAFWRSRDNASDSNRPAAFAAKDLAIIRFLDTFWSPEVSRDDRILELGSNCGANLNGLMQLGYGNVGGVEINAEALEEMKRSFPGVAASASIVNGSIEGYLRTAPSASVDVIYTMVVAHHLHPSLTDVFAQMVRVARRHICVIETEVANCTYQFARDFHRVFTRLGCREIRSAEPFGAGASVDYAGCVARLFAVPR